jgi:hypothetical protein
MAAQAGVSQHCASSRVAFGKYGGCTTDNEQQRDGQYSFSLDNHLFFNNLCEGALGAGGLEAAMVVTTAGDF